MGNTLEANGLLPTGSSVLRSSSKMPESSHYPAFHEIQESAFPEVMSLSLSKVDNHTISL
jgi:hypothetical protein